MRVQTVDTTGCQGCPGRQEGRVGPEEAEVRGGIGAEESAGKATKARGHLQESHILRDPRNVPAHPLVLKWSLAQEHCVFFILIYSAGPGLNCSTQDL